MLTGNEPSVGKRQIDFNEILTVTSNKVTLTKTPVGAITNIFVYDIDGTNGKEFTLGTPATNQDEYSIVGKQITLHSSVANGTNVRVYYVVETDNKATTVKVTSDKFGASFRVVLDCQVVDESTKQIFKAQIRIPTAKFEDNFGFDLSVDGDPAVLDLVMEILKPANSVDMYDMIIFDENTIA